MLSELNKLSELNGSNIRRMQLKGSIGYSPIVKIKSERYPILKRLVHVSLEAEYCLGEYYLFNFFVLPGVVHVSDWEENSVVIDDIDISVYIDSAYHTIRANDKYITVYLKKEN